MSKKALILGITGMDGSHLADLLLEKGYEVHGMIRKSSGINTKRITHLGEKVTLHYGDLTDCESLKNVLSSAEPEEIYNEADQDSVAVSFNMPYYNAIVTGASVGVLLEMLKGTNIKFFQPLTSNIFGKVEESPQNESTPLNPQSPYACAKVHAYYLCKFYRGLGVKVSTAIFYNHTSFRQTEEYLVPKLVRSAARMEKGEQDILKLGNINAEIDIGWSPDFMEAAWRIMQHDTPDDFVIGTGRAMAIREMLDVLGIDMKRVKTDASLLRPASTSSLVADYSKAKQILGWAPKTDFQGIVEQIRNNPLPL
jgi:GDPmannose 4,6-dehydratase